MISVTDQLITSLLEVIDGASTELELFNQKPKEIDD